MRNSNKISKRQFSKGLMGVSACSILFCNTMTLANQGDKSMYGLINKITATKDKRDELANILMEGLKNMPGNLSYIVAEDATDDITLWVTEVWQDKASHEASLSLKSVQEAIQKGRPLIAGLDRISETIPLGGHGL